ncbi:MAG: hypothetical protein PVF83_15945 [Anaerolineales bacterium]
MPDDVFPNLPLGFYPVLEASPRQNQVAVVYRLPALSRDPYRSCHVVLNTNKSAHITFTENDSIILLDADESQPDKFIVILKEFAKQTTEESLYPSNSPHTSTSCNLLRSGVPCGRSPRPQSRGEHIKNKVSLAILTGRVSIKLLCW